MTVGFRDSLGMFLFNGWDGGRKSNFGYYFATLVFVATLCFLVEAIPYIRGKFFSPSSPSSHVKGFDQIQNPSTMDENIKPLVSQTQAAPKMSLCWHLLDTGLQLIAKAAIYLLMLSVMSYNFGVILTASVGLPLANFAFSVLQDQEYIKRRMMA